MNGLRRWWIVVWLVVGATAVVMLPNADVARAGGEWNEAVEAPQACRNGTQSSGALYRICMPTAVINPAWNGELVVYAHGYVAADEPLAIPEEANLLATLVNAQGYAFATTSYRTNGLAVVTAVADVAELVDLFAAEEQPPDEVYLAGVSEGGLVAALAVEQDENGRYSGAVAACGPIGDFQRQINYVADFRLVFDVYFPGLMPGDPWQIPPDLMANWDAFYAATIQPAISDPARADDVAQLLAVTQLPVDPADPNTIEPAIETALRYGVMTTNDAVDKLGGIPFDNQTTQYGGSGDDAALNAAIRRVEGDVGALTAVGDYQTSGRLTKPLVTLHTVYDPVVPQWHTGLYAAKVAANSHPAYLEQLEEDVFGHCNFSTATIQAALELLAERVANPPVVVPEEWGVFLPAVVGGG